MPGRSPLRLAADATRAALVDAGVGKGELDGVLACSAFASPFHRFSVAVAEYLGIQPTFSNTLQVSGATAATLFHIAAVAIAGGLAETVLVVGADSLLSGLTPDLALRSMSESRDQQYELRGDPPAAGPLRRATGGGRRAGPRARARGRLRDAGDDHPRHGGDAVISTEDALKKPLPQPDPDSAAYWAALKEGRLLLQHCLHCGHVQVYQQGVCRQCGSERLEHRAASGRGRVHSFSVVHRAPGPAFRPDTPYAVLLVELEEGPRMISSLVEGDAAAVDFDMAVELTCEQVSDEVTLPRFRPAGLKAGRRLER